MKTRKVTFSETLKAIRTARGILKSFDQQTLEIQWEEHLQQERELETARQVKPRTKY